VLHGAFGWGIPPEAAASNEDDEERRIGEQHEDRLPVRHDARDGTQSQEISLSVLDKVSVAEKLESSGSTTSRAIPREQPKDKEFFDLGAQDPVEEFRPVRLRDDPAGGEEGRRGRQHEGARRRRHPGHHGGGKSWDFHVFEALRTTLEENLHAVRETVAFLKKHADKVFFDAEHFFDGYKNNPKYTMKVLAAAATPGGLPRPVRHERRDHAIRGRADRQDVRKATGTAIGIHTHNDRRNGGGQLGGGGGERGYPGAGTINGYGERCGNANLCS